MKKIISIVFSTVLCIFAMAFSVSADKWVETKSGVKYQYDDGSYAKQGWLNVNGKKYYITKSGVRKKGWLTTTSGTKYYFGKDGAALKGWYNIGGDKYYFDKNCKMVTGELIMNDTMYHFNDDDGVYLYSFKLNDFQKTLRMHDCWVYDIDSVGGVDVAIGWTNMSKKTIKYIYFTVTPYNAVNDVVSCEITGDSTRVLKETGPYATNEGEYFYDPVTRLQFGSTWTNVWYNSTIDHLYLTKVKIEYTDGSSTTISDRDLQSLYY